MVQISMTATSEKKPLDILMQLVEARMKLLKQTAKQALDATAVQLVKSLRAVTRVAKVEKADVEECQGLKLSFASRGKEAPKPCLRWQGTNVRFIPPSNSSVKFTGTALANWRGAQVFTFKTGYGQKQKTVYIAATSASEARREAKQIIKRRIEQYKGLAKLAWSILSWKIASTSLGGSHATAKAGNVARSQTRLSRGDGWLVIEDNLDYAELALKNGKGDIDLAARRASNSIAGMINKKLENKGLHERIETPFPKG